MRMMHEGRSPSARSQSPMFRLASSAGSADTRRAIRVPAPEQPRTPRTVPVTLIEVGEAAPRGLQVALRLMRTGVVLGMLAAAWQAGVVIGHF